MFLKSYECNVNRVVKKHLPGVSEKGNGFNHG